MTNLKIAQFCELYLPSSIVVLLVIIVRMVRILDMLEQNNNNCTFGSKI